MNEDFAIPYEQRTKQNRERLARLGKVAGLLLLGGVVGYAVGAVREYAIGYKEGSSDAYANAVKVVQTEAKAQRTAATELEKTALTSSTAEAKAEGLGHVIGLEEAARRMDTIVESLNAQAKVAGAR
jgi:hypothetical protein